MAMLVRTERENAGRPTPSLYFRGLHPLELSDDDVQHIRAALGGSQPTIESSSIDFDPSPFNNHEHCSGRYWTPEMFGDEPQM